jgi:hypothetical protein
MLIAESYSASDPERVLAKELIHTALVLYFCHVPIIIPAGRPAFLSRFWRRILVVRRRNNLNPTCSTAHGHYCFWVDHHVILTLDALY